MNDPLREFVKGDAVGRLRDHATLNALLEGAKRALGQSRARTGGEAGASLVTPGNTVWIKAHDELPLGGVVKIASLTGFDPADDAAGAGDTAAQPAFVSAGPVAGEPFLILTRDADEGDGVAAVVSGAALTRLLLPGGVAYDYADVITGDTAKLVSAASGPVRVLWVEEDAESGSGSGEDIRWAIVLLGGAGTVAGGDGGTAACPCPRPLNAGLHADTLSLWVVDADGLTIAGAQDGSVQIPWQRDADDAATDPVGPHSAIWWLDNDGAGSGSGSNDSYFKCSRLYGWMFFGVWGGKTYGSCSTEAGDSSQSVTGFICDPFCLEITLDSGVRMRVWAAGTENNCMASPPVEGCDIGVPPCGCPGAGDSDHYVCLSYRFSVPVFWCGSYQGIGGCTAVNHPGTCQWFCGAWVLTLSSGGGGGSLVGIYAGNTLTYSVAYRFSDCRDLIATFSSASDGSTPGSGIPSDVATIELFGLDCCDADDSTPPPECQCDPDPGPISFTFPAVDFSGSGGPNYPGGSGTLDYLGDCQWFGADGTSYMAAVVTGDGSGFTVSLSTPDGFATYSGTSASCGGSFGLVSASPLGVWPISVGF